MLKTHTGARIKHWEGVWTCGAWSVSGLVMDENRPGRARQMRRMVAKAKRREWRELQAGRPVFRIKTQMTPEVFDAWKGAVHAMTQGRAPARAIGVDPAFEGSPVVLDVSSVPPAELDALKARLRAYVDSAKWSFQRIVPTKAIIADDLAELDAMTPEEREAAKARVDPWMKAQLVPQDNILHCRPGGLFEEKPVTAADLELWRSIPTSPVPTPSCMTCYDEGIVWDTDADDHEVANPCWNCPKGEEYARAEREFNGKADK